MTGPDPSAGVDRMRTQLTRDVLPVVAGVRRAFLLGYPAHPNAGDSVIWLGQLRLMAQLGIQVVGIGRPGAVDARALRDAPPDVAVLLSGGGDFGDLWPDTQARREATVRAAGGRRVIQLPQSLCYRDPQDAASARAVLMAHGDVTLAWRDTRSLEDARELFPGVPSVLLPDVGFAADLRRPDRPPDLDLVVVARPDHESGGLAALGPEAGVGPVDDWAWHTGTPTRLARDAVWTALALERRAKPFLPARARMRLCDAVAARVVASAVAGLSRGRVVVSDRLHAHILSTMLGIQHVMVDTPDGKIRAFVETWGVDNPFVHIAASPADAVERARALVSETA